MKLDDKAYRKSIKNIKFPFPTSPYIIRIIIYSDTNHDCSKKSKNVESDKYMTILAVHCIFFVARIILEEE